MLFVRLATTTLLKDEESPRAVSRESIAYSSDVVQRRPYANRE